MKFYFSHAFPRNSVFALLLCVLFLGCSKNDYLVNSSHLKKFEYTGNNSYLQTISSQLSSLSIAGIENLEDAGLIFWDKYRIVRALGDTTSSILVPFFKGNLISNCYLNIKLSGRNEVALAAIKSFNESDQLSSAEKLWLKGEMEAIGIIASKQLLDSKTSNLISSSKASLQNNVVENNSIEPNCSTTVIGYFSYFENSPYENAISFFNSELRRELTLTGFPFSIGPGGLGISIAGPAGLSGQIPAIWFAAAASTNQVYPNAITFSGIDFQTECSNDTGGGSASAADAPCNAKARITTIAKNPLVKPKSAAIESKLSSSAFEWGIAVNYTSTTNGTIATTQLVTNSDSSYVEIPMSWDTTSGFSVGGIHSHPAGSVPDQHDVFAMITQLSNVSGSGSQAVNFYKQNAFQTIVTVDGNYTVTVKDWSKLAELFVSRQQNPISFDENIESLKNDHDEMYAMLMVFGQAINMFITDQNDADYIPISLNLTNGNIEPINCP